MKCDFSLEQLSAYLDNELDQEQMEQIRQHLESCEYCQQRLAALKTVDDRVRTLAIEEPSREFYFNLNRRVIDRVRKRRRVSFFRLSTILVPAAVAVLIVIVLVNTPQPVQLITVDDRVPYKITHETVRTKTDVDFTLSEVTASKDAEAEPSDVRGVYAGKAAEREKSIAKPAPAPIVAKKSMPEEVISGGAALKYTSVDDKALRSEEYRDELLNSAVEQEIEIPQDRIVRAIVDTTGRVVKVATGNTLIPEQDTVLENRLKGQQLAPPLVSGRRMQLYVDLTHTEETTR
jgi:hypothetical protein